MTLNQTSGHICSQGNKTWAECSNVQAFLYENFYPFSSYWVALNVISAWENILHTNSFWVACHYKVNITEGASAQITICILKCWPYGQLRQFRKKIGLIMTNFWGRFNHIFLGNWVSRKIALEIYWPLLIQSLKQGLIRGISNVLL